MEVKQVLAGSRRAIRIDQNSTNKNKPTNRLPLQDQTNIIIKRNDPNNAMVGRKLKTLTETNADNRSAVLQDIKRRSTFVSLDRGIESIVSPVKNTDVLDKRKEKNVPVGRKLKSRLNESETNKEGIVEIAKVDAKELSTRKSRSVTRRLNIGDAKDVEKAAVKKQKNTASNVLKGRKEKENIAKHVADKQEICDAVLRDINRRSSFVPLERNIESILVAVKNTVVSDNNEENSKEPENIPRSKRNSKTRKSEKSNETNNQKTKIGCVGEIKAVKIQESGTTKEKQAKNVAENTVGENRRILRGNKRLNYAELSGNKSKEKEKVKVNDDGKHHPIYERTRASPENCEPDDVYEFNSDSENVKKTKRKRATVVYDKGMDSVVEKLEKKFKKTRKPTKAKVAKKQIPPKNQAKTIPNTKNLKKRIPDNLDTQNNASEVEKSNSKQIPTNKSQKDIPNTKESQKNLKQISATIKNYSKEIQNETDSGKRIPGNFNTQDDIIPVDTDSNSKQIPLNKSPKEILHTKESQKNLKQIPTTSKNYSKEIQNATDSLKRIPNNFNAQDDIIEVDKDSNSIQIPPKEVPNSKESQKNLKQIPKTSKNYSKEIQTASDSRKRIPDNFNAQDDIIEVDKDSNSKQIPPKEVSYSKESQKNLQQIPTTSKNYSKEIQTATDSRKRIPDNFNAQDDIIQVDKDVNSKQILLNKHPKEVSNANESQKNLKQIPTTSKNYLKEIQNATIQDDVIQVDMNLNSKQPPPNKSPKNNFDNLIKDNVKNSKQIPTNSWKRIPNNFNYLSPCDNKVQTSNSAVSTKRIPYDVNNCIPHCRHVIDYDYYEESGTLPPCQIRDNNSDESGVPHCTAPDFDHYEDSDDTPDSPGVTSKIFDFDAPIANSTMLNMTRQDGQASPWRSNLNVQRNPHFLHFKESFLPNYNQEMVFQSSTVEKSLRKPVEPTKSHKQASILDYIDGKENEVRIANSTLFDIDQFSPIKGQSSTKNRQESESPKKILSESPKKLLSEFQIVDKENSFVNKQKRRVDRVKRNILGAIVDNEQIVEENSPGISNCFGFDDSVSELVEERVDKPTRAHSLVRIQRRKSRILDDLDNMDDDIVGEDTRRTAHQDGGGLFEDCEPDRTLEYSAIKQYVVPKKRQRRCRSPSPYTDDDQEHHNKKKRNKRTKKEDAEAEKWYAAFNSMCEEVEKFPLEIQ